MHEELNFRLEGIVRSREDENGDFEGPMNLILQMISRSRIEIRDIKISELTDQYLAYLDKMKEMDLEIASEFIRMAAHLLYVKTKTLLARDEEPVEELDELLSSLENLKLKGELSRIKAVCELLRPMEEANLGMFEKERELLPKEGYRYRHEAAELLEALHRMLGRADAEQPPMIVRIPSRMNYPTERKSGELMEKLKKERFLRLYDVFCSCGSRSELVAAFLSVLELCRSGAVLLVGSGEECIMRLVSSDETGVEYGKE